MPACELYVLVFIYVHSFDIFIMSVLNIRADLDSKQMDLYGKIATTTTPITKVI